MLIDKVLLVALFMFRADIRLFFDGNNYIKCKQIMLKAEKK